MGVIVFVRRIVNIRLSLPHVTKFFLLPSAIYHYSIINHFEKERTHYWASGNLGQATVRKFISERYKVLAAVSPGKSLGFDVDGDLTIYEADLPDEKSSDNLVKQIIKEHSSIDAALLLVGGFAAGGIRETNSGLLKKMFPQFRYDLFCGQARVSTNAHPGESRPSDICGSEAGIKTGPSKRYTGLHIGQVFAF